VYRVKISPSRTSAYSGSVTVMVVEPPRATFIKLFWRSITRNLPSTRRSLILEGSGDSTCHLVQSLIAETSL
jgi:hypothetical protein